MPVGILKSNATNRHPHSLGVIIFDVSVSTIWTLFFRRISAIFGTSCRLFSFDLKRSESRTCSTSNHGSPALIDGRLAFAKILSGSLWLHFDSTPNRSSICLRMCSMWGTFSSESARSCRTFSSWGALRSIGLTIWLSSTGAAEPSAATLPVNGIDSVSPFLFENVIEFRETF